MKVEACIHSLGGEIQEVEILEKLDDGYKVKTEAGVVCHAIFNPFTGLYYADDKYYRMEE